MELVIVIWAAFVGACLGSFAAVVNDRGGLSQTGGRSQCACGRQLWWWENIPIVSWLALRGTSTCCHTRIPVSCLTYELVGAGIGGVGAMGLLAVLA